MAERFGLSDERDILELAVSELVTNAVVHGHAAKDSHITVTYRLTEDRLRVEARDRATGTPTVNRTAPLDSDSAEGGRGLALIALITDRWGVTPHVIGKSVRFEIKRAAADAPPDLTETATAYPAKPAAYGYLRAHEGRSDDEVRDDELQMFRWAQAEGYDLSVVHREDEDGGIAELTELVEELKRSDIRLVVIPSFAHLAATRPLQDHLWAYLVRAAGAEIHEAWERKLT